MAVDDINAYGQTPALDEPLYLLVDDQYRDCYRDKRGINNTLVFFLPVNGAFPGHPQAVSLWANLILSFLSELGFKVTAH